jgi:lycopene cyclase CruA
MKQHESVIARVREAGGAELVERLLALESSRAREVSAPMAMTEVDRDARPDFDVVLAGGGLWSMLAPLLAGRGLRVAVIDRHRACTSHREWNASEAELEPLVRCGLCTPEELQRLIIARYDYGTCGFSGGDLYPVEHVLDRAIDAGPLMRLIRAKSEQAGVTFFDHTEILAERGGGGGVQIRVRTTDGATRTLLAGLMVDARGAQSPYQRADLVCPTVGGVLEGLTEGTGPREMNPRVGEILATVDGIGEDGRQHVWEAFPGHPGQTTVYVFYYARVGEPVSLLSLYDRFFQTLPTYKGGDAKLIRPTFGWIPGWSRLTPAPRSPHRRIALVGDAAARHSPLTYCGFGATLRSLEAALEHLLRAHEAGAFAGDSIVDDRPVHTFTGALAHMMATRAFRGEETNQLLDASFRTLFEMGSEAYESLLRDEMAAADVITYLRKTSVRHPAVWGKVMRGLGFGSAARWSVSIARAMLAA